MKCKYCETELKEDWKFCPNCCGEIKEQENDEENNEEVKKQFIGITISIVLLLIQFASILLKIYDYFDINNDDVLMIWLLIRYVFSVGSLLVMIYFRNRNTETTIFDILIMIQIIYFIFILPILLFKDCENMCSCN